MITEKCTLEMQNVLSYRGKMTQQQMAEKMQEISKLIEAADAHKTGPTVTATFAVEQNGGAPVMDIEVLLPMDKIFSTPDGYIWKPHFLLTNAVKLHHEGNPALLQACINELNAYMTEHHLVPITAGYNVTVKEAASPQDMDSMVVDVYVGISPNTL